MTRALNASEFSRALRVTIPAHIAHQGRRIYLDATTQLHEAIVLDTPVQTGYLRAGLLATTEGAPPEGVPSVRATNAVKGQYVGLHGASAARAMQAIAASVKGLVLLTIGFIASYAPHVEDRRHMVKRARGRWASMVALAVRNAGGGTS